MKIFHRIAGMLISCTVAPIVILLSATLVSANQDFQNENETQFKLNAIKGSWLLKIEPTKGITHFGLDSEEQGHSKTNLLAEPVCIIWDGCGKLKSRWIKVADNKLEAKISSSNEKASIKWTVSTDSNEFNWQIENTGIGYVNNLKVEIPINQLEAAAVLIPSGLDKNNRGLGPWLLVAPDFGHFLITAESDLAVVGINDGVRGSGSNAVSTGVDPRLRGKQWLEAAKISDYKAGKLTLRFCCDGALPGGGKLKLRFQVPEIMKPEGIESKTWQKIRRPYLNNWQPCGTWCGLQKAMALSNNVLSDPASCSLWFYSEPMLFLYEPVDGIDLRGLLKHSLNYWLDNEVSSDGHVNAFGSTCDRHDMYVFTGGALIISAWDYWVISQDKKWLENRIQTLHLMADYLLRRDVDGDGLIESLSSGNAGMLRDPERADVWFESMNFGWKNAWTNLISYRAFLCMAEMLDEAGQTQGAQYYR